MQAMPMQSRLIRNGAVSAKIWKQRLKARETTIPYSAGEWLLSKKNNKGTMSDMIKRSIGPSGCRAIRYKKNNAKKTGL